MCYHLLHYTTANDMTGLLALSGMGVPTMSHASHLVASPAMWYHSLLFLTRESVRVVVDSGDCSPRAQKSSSIAKSIVSHCFPRPAPVVLPSPEVTKSGVSHCFPNPPLVVLPTRKHMFLSSPEKRGIRVFNHPSPFWLKGHAFRQRVLSNPRTTAASLWRVAVGAAGAALAAAMEEGKAAVKAIATRYRDIPFQKACRLFQCGFPSWRFP
jgi:hypothetical protein